MTPAEKEARIVKALTEPMSLKCLSNLSRLTGAQLYPTLVRMELAGTVLSEWERAWPRCQRIYRLV